MKQQVLCCLLLTISAGTCSGYGVKGSFSKSYSSSSASASSSAFSSSFASGDNADLNDITKPLNAEAQASAAAYAHAGTDGAKASSGSFATAGSGAFAEASSGSYSGSGSTPDSGLQAGHNVQLGQDSHSGNSGSYSAAGSYTGTGSTCTTCSGSGASNVGSDASNAGSGASNAGSGASNAGSGASNAGGNSGSTVGLINVIGHGSSHSQQDTKYNAVNNAGSGSDSGAGNVIVNDFKIPNEYPNPKTTPAFNQVITGYKSDNYDGINKGSKPCCQGPFPGPKGSITDFKPAPPGGGGPPAWTPEEQKPSTVNTGIYQGATNTGTIGLSSHLIHSFPGSHGSIYDSKPAFDKPYNHGGNIPVSVIPVIVETPQQPIQTHVPSSGAISVIGTLPGSTGSIDTSIPAGQYPKPQYVPVPQTPLQPTTNYDNEKPGPSLDLIHSFPGKPGNIHDSKAVPCAGGQCQSNDNVYNGNQNYNAGTGSVSGTYRPNQPKTPDCSTGQCDEYGGKLACHGNDCFGPGKKPSNAHFSAGSNANSNAQHETGSINIDLSEQSIGTYQQGSCKSGNCNEKPTDVGMNCANGKCGGYSPQKPEHGIISVDLTPINVPSVSQQNIYPAPGSINFGVDYPVPSTPGTICSGLQCLLPGTKKFPSSSTTGCTGAYCINVVPESQVTTSCSGGNCHNQHKNIHESNSNVHESQGKVDFTGTVEQPIKAELPFSPEHIQKEVPAADNKPHDQGPSSSHDFLLPGNKPYHRHMIKPHQPTTPKTVHEKPASEGYYTCTGTSCPLPKHPGQITPQPTPNFPATIIPSPGQQSCSGNDCTPQLMPFTIPDEYKGAGGHDRLYPGYNQNESPQLKPFKIPNEYKVTEDQDQKVETPLVIPVIIGGEPQIQGKIPVSHYPGTNTGNNGFVAGEVLVQKSDGIEVPVVDVYIPGSIIPGYSCSGGQCDGSKPTTNNGFVQGTNSEVYSGSSGAHFQGNVQGSGCSGGLCKIPISGDSASGCIGGKCGFNGGISGWQAGSSNDNINGYVQGSGCTGGKCGTDLTGASHSGSGSYGGGCSSGNCGSNGKVSGSQADLVSGNLHGNFQGSGCTGGKCGNDLSAGSHSGSGSYSGTGSHGGGCSSGKCGSNGGVSGSQAGSSSENIQGYLQGSECSGGKCGTDLSAGSHSGSGNYGGGCSSGNCGSHGGSKTGYSSGNVEGYLQGNGCTGGKCGTDLSAGSHSGSGSYSGSGGYGGAKGGCKGGSCGLSGNNGAYSGAFSSSSSIGGSGSGAYSGSGASSKAFSSSSSSSFLTNGQGDGFGGFPLLKELIDKSIGGGDFHSGAGAFSGSRAYSGGGSGSHSSAYSSAGSFAAK